MKSAGVQIQEKHFGLSIFLKQHILAKQHFLVFQAAGEAVLEAGKQHSVREDCTHQLPANQYPQGLNVLTPPSGLTKAKNKTKKETHPIKAT